MREYASSKNIIHVDMKSLVVVRRRASWRCVLVQYVSSDYRRAIQLCESLMQMRVYGESHVQIVQIKQASMCRGSSISGHSGVLK